jgi:ABC-2 type transport system ATP-binding protein
VLDEPTSGVSPLARSRLWDVIHEQAESGVGVLVSTHYMDEAEQADRLVVMARGQTVAVGPSADIVGGRMTVEVVAERWAEAFGALDRPGRRIRLAGRSVRVLGEPVDVIAADLARAGIEATTTSVPATLEEVLIELDAAQVSEVVR